jgi:hypothetical protein
MRTLPTPARIAAAPAIILTLSAATAFAGDLTCYENPSTNAHSCFESNNVREKAGIRYAPMFSGGPNRIRPTPYSLHVNCATGVAHLKDADGVSFAGAAQGGPALQTLRNAICKAPLRR